MKYIRSLTFLLVIYVASSTSFVFATPITTNLLVWLDAQDASTLVQATNCIGALASSNGNPIGCWKSKAPATINATSPNNPTRPTRQTQTINGTSRTVVRFDGVNDIYQNITTLTGSTISNHTLFLVYRRTSGNAGIFGFGATPNFGFAINSANRGYFYTDRYHSSDGIVELNSSPTVYSVITVTQNSSSAQMYYNNVFYPMFSGVSNANSKGTFSLGRGSTNATNYYLTGDLVEVLLYNVSLTGQQREAVSLYLGCKYGLTSGTGAYDCTAPYDLIPSNRISTTTDQTPNLTFYSPVTLDSLTFGGSCRGVTGTLPTAGSLAGTYTITLEASSGGNLANGTYSNCTIQANVGTGTQTNILTIPTFDINTSFSAPGNITSQLIGWYDASDPYSLFQDNACTNAVVSNGQSIGCWKNKVQSGYDLTTSVVAEKPQYAVNTINTIGETVSFLASSPNFSVFKQVAGTSTSISVEGDKTLFFVVRRTDTGNRGLYVYNALPSASGFLPGYGAAFYGRVGPVNGGSGWISAPPAITSGQYYVLTVYQSATPFVDGANTYFGNYYVDNVATARYTSAQANYSYNDNGYITLGRYNNATANNFLGNIAEILVYNRTLSITEKNAVAKDLGCRYGIVAFTGCVTPIVTQVTPVPTPTTDTTPNYTFNTTIAGGIIYDGSCASGSTLATVGNNTITFSALVPGVYSDCSIRVNNAGNISSYLLISPFTIHGPLSVDIVDSSGVSVTSPEVIFGSVTSSFSTQIINGTLGISSERVRASNPTSSSSWSISIAPLGGAPTWTASGGKTILYDGASINLEVQPSLGTISRVGGGSTAGVSVGANATFSNLITSITLMSSSTGATFSSFDLTGVTLIQDIPARQASGNYSLPMTITIL